jgi:hypothetical protein
VPDQVRAGGSATEYAVDGVATVVSDQVRSTLRSLGVATLGGTAVHTSFLDAPNFQLEVDTHVDVSEVQVPDGPPLEFVFAGHTLPFSFNESNVGEGVIEVRDMVLHMEARDANGDLTFPNEFEAPCRMVDDDPVLHEFLICSAEDEECDPGDGNGGDDCETPPAAPANLRSTGTSENSISVAWDHGDEDRCADAFEVFVDGESDDTVTGTSHTIGGLAPETSYDVHVVGSNEHGASPASDTLTVETDGEVDPCPDPPCNGGGDLDLSFDLDGESFIRAANGTVPLSGTIDVSADVAAGTHVSELALDDTTGNFRILGFLGTQADVSFAQTADTTGTFSLADGGSISSTSEMHVTLTQVRAFGLPIGGGADCRTQTPSTIDLATPAGEGFDPFGDGGRITGDYELAPLDADECGFLGSFISLFMAGPGNTIDMQLTPTS